MQRWIGLLCVGVFSWGVAGCAGGSDDDQNQNDNQNQNQGVCGDGQATGAEECDGADLREQTCEGLGHQGGTLTCYMSCTYDESGCSDDPCGNGVRESGEACDDGNTTSGDGCSADCKLEAPRWIQASPAHAPPERGQHGMAYDATRGVVVLFGGTDNQGQDQLGDTWEYDGLDWTQVTPTTSPPARFGHAMAYDASRGRVVLFGGASTSGGNTTFLADTWDYDGTTWTEISPTPSPAASAGHRLVYDTTRERIVYVGSDFMGSAVTATWDYDGTTWTDTTTQDHPLGRGVPAAVYDGARDRLVLFGGSRSDGSTVTYLQDTWEWDRSAWDPVVTASVPPGRTDAMAVFHVRRGHFVLFGGPTGVGNEPLLDTWEYDGVVWQNTSTSAAPHAPGVGVYDSGRGRIVLFGGCISTASFTGCLDETWEMDYASY